MEYLTWYLSHSTCLIYHSCYYYSWFNNLFSLVLQRCLLPPNQMQMVPLKCKVWSVTLCQPLGFSIAFFCHVHDAVSLPSSVFWCPLSWWYPLICRGSHPSRADWCCLTWASVPLIAHEGVLQSGKRQVPTLCYAHSMCVTQLLLFYVAFSVY